MKLKFIDTYDKDTLGVAREPNNVNKTINISRLYNTITINRLATIYMNLNPKDTYNIAFSFVIDEDTKDKRFVVIIHSSNCTSAYKIGFIHAGLARFCSKHLTTQFYKEFTPTTDKYISFIVGDKITVEGFICYELKHIKK